MANLNTTTLLTSFEYVLKEMQAEIDRAVTEGQSAFARKDFSSVDRFRQRAEHLTELRNRAVNLQSDWQKLMPSPIARGNLVCATVMKESKTGTAVKRSNLGRLKRGMRT
ncbi:MAG: hypothetical protein ACREJM_11925, partial [Candidatus Saccharimonadales bacterium]